MHTTRKLNVRKSFLRDMIAMGGGSPDFVCGCAGDVVAASKVASTFSVRVYIRQPVEEDQALWRQAER